MKKRFIPLALGVLSLGANANDIKTTHQLSLDLADQIATRAQQNCAQLGVFVSVSVVNEQGTLLMFRRGEGAGPHTVTTSFRKAYTAASLKMPSVTLSKAVEAPGFTQLAKMSDEILLLQGGLPINHKGQTIGGIGMSGAPAPEVEEKCAFDAVNELMPKG